MEYAPTDDEKQEGELEREIALPADWDNAYVRVEARRSTDNKSYGSFAAPIFIRRY
jgi:hypothetical protein